jgi:hypothetical protein
MSEREWPPVFVDIAGTWLRRDLVAAVRPVEMPGGFVAIVVLNDNGDELTRVKVYQADAEDAAEDIVRSLTAE